MRHGHLCETRRQRQRLGGQLVRGVPKAMKKDDGTLEANRVNVGRDGITPPM